MKRINMYILLLPLLIGSFLIFTYMDIGWSFSNPIKLITPFLFSVTLTLIVFLPILKKLLLYISIFLMIAMVLFYLINLLELANWIGSLGFGILTIVVICLIPQLVKKGYIETFD